MRVFILLLLILLVGCSSKTYSPTEMWNMGQAVDSNIKFILPETINDGVQCTDYGVGCLGGKQAKVRMVLLTVVEFETEEQACFAAKQIDQWCARNWLFDEVTDEPVLEDFVQRAFNAKKARLIKEN